MLFWINKKPNIACTVKHNSSFTKVLIRKVFYKMTEHIVFVGDLFCCYLFAINKLLFTNRLQYFPLLSLGLGLI